VIEVTAKFVLDKCLVTEAQRLSV